MRKSAIAAAGVKGILATTIVGLLIGSTFVSIAAANGMATITVDVEFRSTRPLDANSIKGRLLAPEESGGYGYGGYTPAGYGYTFINWLQNGYGYASFDTGHFTESGATLKFDDIPVGTYRVQVWYELNGNGMPDEGIEPIAFAETGDALDGTGTLITVELGDNEHAYAVLAEASASFTGSVLDQFNSPVSGADVAVMLHGSQTVVSVSTDANGAYTLTLPTGLWYDLTYSIQASYNGVMDIKPAASLGRNGTALSPFQLYLPTQAPSFSFRAGWNAEPIDSDNDGLYDLVRVNATISTDAPVDAVLIASVSGASTPPSYGYIPDAYAYHEHNIYDEGSEVVWEISGEPIRAAGLDPVRVDIFAYAHNPSLPGGADYAHPLGSDTKQFTNLGQAAQYTLPGLLLGTPTAMPIDTDEPANGLYDYVEVSLPYTVSRPTEAQFFVSLYGENWQYIPYASDFIELTTYAQNDTLTFTIPGDRISAANISPVGVSIVAVRADFSPIASVNILFQGGEASQYEGPAVQILPQNIVPEPIMSAATGKIEKLNVTVTPTINTAGEYRFSVTLMTSDYVYVAWEMVPGHGESPSTMVSGSSFSVSFDGAELNRTMPGFDWNITRIQVAAYAPDYAFLALGELSPISPGWRASDFVAPVLPIVLPDAESVMIEITCGRDKLPCTAQRPESDAAGWTQLNVRLPVTVNTAGSYAFNSRVETNAGASLADFFQQHLPLETSLPSETHPQGLELTFRGSDIARNGGQLGDPARVDIDALSEFYELITSTSKTLTGVTAADFESLGVQMSLGAPTPTSAKDLRVPVTLTHTGRQGTSYHLQLVLSNATDYWFITYNSTSVTLGADNAMTVNVDLDGRQIYSFLNNQGLASTRFRLAAYLAEIDTWEMLLHAETGPTDVFYKTQFPTPAVEIGSPLTSVARDTDTPADGLYDDLRVTVPLNVAAGTDSEYFVSAVVFGPGYQYVTGNWTNFRVTGATTQVPVEITTFPGRHFSSRDVNGPYTTYVALFDSSWNFVGYREVTSPTYLASQFESGGVRIGTVADAASGTNPPGYDGIRLTPQLSVNGDAAGTYGAVTVLYTADWNFVGYEEREVALDETTTAGEFLIPADQIRLSGVNGVVRYYMYYYDLDSLQTVASKYGILSSSYNAANFRVSGFEYNTPGVSGNVGAYVDAQADQNTTLRITANVNVGTPGTYRANSNLYTSDGRWISHVSRNVTFATAGAGTIAFDFDAVDIIASGSTGPFQAYFTAYDSDWMFVSATRDAFVTAQYPLTSWALAPPIDLRGPLAAETNTTSSGKVASISQQVTFDVNDAGTYTISAALIATDPVNGTKVQVAGAERSQTFTAQETGAGKTVTLTFRAEDIRPKLPAGFDGAFTVEVKAFRSASGRAQLVDSETVQTTNTYQLSSFVPPNPSATIQSITWTTIDSNGDGRFEELRVTLNLNVTTSGTFRARGTLEGPSDYPLFIQIAEVTVSLLPGTQSLDLTFTGSRINAAGINGVYRIGWLSLIAESGERGIWNNVATANNIGAPNSYTASNFNS